MAWFRGVTVSTLDSESSDPSSNLGGTLVFLLFLHETVMQSDYGNVLIRWWTLPHLRKGSWSINPICIVLIPNKFQIFLIFHVTLPISASTHFKATYFLASNAFGSGNSFQHLPNCVAMTDNLEIRGHTILHLTLHILATLYMLEQLR